MGLVLGNLALMGITGALVFEKFVYIKASTHHIVLEFLLLVGQPSHEDLLASLGVRALLSHADLFQLEILDLICESKDKD